MPFDDIEGQELVEKKRYDDLLQKYNELITRLHNLDQDMIFVRAENKELKDALKKLTEDKGFKKASNFPQLDEPQVIKNKTLFASTTDDKLITALAFMMRKHPKKIVVDIEGDKILSFGVENV
jgi:hypothetical protein